MTDDTAQRLRDIEARHAASTPGEWTARHRCSVATADDDEMYGLGLEIDGPPEASNRGQFERAADAQFIARAHQDVPFLLAEIERLEARIDNQREHQWSDLEKLALSFKENF